MQNEKYIKNWCSASFKRRISKHWKIFFKFGIQLALYDISNENIKIYPKDSKGNTLDNLKSAKEFEKYWSKNCNRANFL